MAVFVLGKNKSTTCRSTDKQHFRFTWAGRHYSFWWDKRSYKGEDYFELYGKRPGGKWYMRIEGGSQIVQACEMWAKQPFYGGLNAAQFLKRTLRVRDVRWRK